MDTPTREELIASSNNPEEIRQFLCADSLGYVSLPGLKQAVNDTRGDYCTSCYTGVYPTDLVQLEVRENGINGQRIDAASHKPGEAVAQPAVTVERES